MDDAPVPAVWRPPEDAAPEELPGALGAVQRSLPVGRPLVVEAGPSTGWSRARLADVVVGAGFALRRPPRRRADGTVVAACVRARTLADTVGPGMRLLVCGVNPSLFSADAGVGYARPGNRYWPAALAAGLVTQDRNAVAALSDHAVGMTDLVKRATATAAELTSAEYAAGFARVERLVAWLLPGAVCFVGLSGWRDVVDRRAVAGPQPEEFGGRPAYVMPSTSGRNARTSLDDASVHLAAALALALAPAPGGPGGVSRDRRRARSARRRAAPRRRVR